MIRKLTKVLESLEDRLRQMCGEITPDKRLIVVLTMLVLFSGLSIYFTVSSIYRIGKHAGEKKQIEQLENLRIILEEAVSSEIEE